MNCAPSRFAPLKAPKHVGAEIGFFAVLHTWGSNLLHHPHLHCVDPSAATAQDFELMDNHDTHPIFTGYHLEMLGYYQSGDIKELQWDRNPYHEDIDVIAHGLAEDSDTNHRFHILKIKVSDALTYYVEVRQRPGTTAQILDDSIPIAAAPSQGGVIVTRVIAGEMFNNQQTRFIGSLR
jgi:hypothetical protein